MRFRRNKAWPYVSRLAIDDNGTRIGWAYFVQTGDVRGLAMVTEDGDTYRCEDCGTSTCDHCIAVSRTVWP